MEIAILRDAIFSIMALLLLIFIGFGVVIYKLCSNILKVARGDVSSLPKPPFRLHYKIPQTFGRYLWQRDGWRGELPFFGQFVIFTIVAWVGISLLQLGSFDLGKYFVIFIGFGVMFIGMRLFTQNYDRGISFYTEGVGNRPKGRRTNYSHYAKAIIKKIDFESQTFQVITLVPKSETWLTLKDEYGFSADVDLAPLIALLKEHGLSIEERIEGAPPIKLA